MRKLEVYNKRMMSEKKALRNKFHWGKRHKKKKKNQRGLPGGWGSRVRWFDRPFNQNAPAITPVKIESLLTSEDRTDIEEASVSLWP